MIRRRTRNIIACYLHETMLIQSLLEVSTDLFRYPEGRGNCSILTQKAKPSSHTYRPTYDLHADTPQQEHTVTNMHSQITSLQILVLLVLLVLRTGKLWSAAPCPSCSTHMQMLPLPSGPDS